MRKTPIVLSVILIIVSAFTAACSCGDDNTATDTETTSSFNETGEGVLISSKPESEMPQMPEVGTPEDIDELTEDQGSGDNTTVPAILKFLKEVVTVERDGNPIDTYSSMKIFPGDVIIIDEVASATIHSFDGSVSILQGPCEIEFFVSEKTVEGAETTSTVELELESGSVLTKVGDLFSSASSHKVRTANTVAGAWGTIYQVEVTPDSHTICRVPRGSIRVAYIAQNRQGDAEIFTQILQDRLNNYIDIPQPDENLRTVLAERFNLAGNDRRTVIDYLKNMLETEENQTSASSPVPTQNQSSITDTPEPTRTSIIATITPEPTSEPGPTGTTAPDNSADNTSFLAMNQDEIFKRIMEAVNNIETCKFDKTMNMKMEGGSGGAAYHIGLKMIQKAIADYTNEKMYIDSQMTTAMDAMDYSMDMEMYIIGDTMYTRMEGMFGLGSQWIKTEASDMWTSQDMVIQMTSLVKTANARVSDGGYVNGYDCYQVEMAPHLGRLFEIMSSQPGLDAGASGSMIPDDFNPGGFAEMVKEFSVIQWYAKNTLFPVKTEMDMVIALDPETLDPMDMDESGEMHMNMQMSIDFRDYNEPVSINLPPEAESADNNLEMFQPSSGLYPDNSSFSSSFQTILPDTSANEDITAITEDMR